ncbi:MAG: branched-chain amino acid transport system permease protein [Actinomycetota bacterium]|jgi:branched-chain amino acid transport system permease protein|nr:branched-chain amino acid transport system permease protein [Actinomycetota bacterium]
MSTRENNSSNFIVAGWEKLGFVRYLIAAAFMWSIPILMDKDIFPVLNGSKGINILFITGYWILLSLGLSVVVGLAGLLDLGYIAFFMLGAYTTALMTASGGPDQFHIVTWPTWAALPFAILVAMSAGLLIGAPTLRLRGDYLAIVTLGFHEIVRQSALNLAIVNQSRGIAGIPNPSIHMLGINLDFGLENELYWWYLLIPAILAAVIMIKRLDNSRVGRYWTAIREDEVAAAAMGVPVVKMKLWAFVIGASTSGVAGWIYAVNISYIAPNSFPLLQSILVLCAVVIGGLGSIAGAVLGAVLITTLPEVVRELSNGKEILGFDPETGRIAIFGLALIIVMIYRPGGLLAAKRRRTELSEAGAADAVVTSDTTVVDEVIDERPAGEDEVH